MKMIDLKVTMPVFACHTITPLNIVKDVATPDRLSNYTAVGIPNRDAHIRFVIAFTLNKIQLN